MHSNCVNAAAPGFTVRALSQSGPITSAMRILMTAACASILSRGPQHRVLSSRTEGGYLGVASRLAALHIGQVGRSWGLPEQLALMVSNGAYVRPSLSLQIGTERLHLSSIVARLHDELVDFATDTIAQRTVVGAEQHIALLRGLAVVAVGNALRSFDNHFS